MKRYHDIVGDGGSGILEQVVAQRARIERRLAGVRRRVAVGSGKGGVGKSTLVRQLASAFRAAGRSVAVFDADLNGPSQARLGGLRGSGWVPASDGLAMPRNAEGIGFVSVGAMLGEGESLEFASVSDVDSHTWRATREFTAVGDLLATVEWGELDVLLFDLPPGAERTFQYAEFLGPDVPFVLVTLPADLSRGVVARSVAALSRTRNRLLGYVENMSGYACDECGKVKPLFPDARRVPLDIECLGRVPFDPLLAAASDDGQPLDLTADRPAARALRETARSVLERMESSN